MPQPFSGFALPTSNTTYAPNQFFDVCLPHSSRGTVRIVAFIIRKTLGWCDADGNPQAERHAVSYTDFEAAGISRGMIRSALAEAVEGHFIRCVRPPQAKKAGQPAVSGLYELQWDSRGEYLKDPRQFRGFFAGDGNRTYIPNQFFDALVPTEPLVVLKVVGSILRFSIGFANKWGHRRRNVALSYQHIQNYTRLRDRSSLSAALQHALKFNYIERVEKGFFDPDAGKLSKASVYALRWADSPLNTATDEAIGMKSRPAEISASHRSKNQTGIGSKTRPAHRYENQTDIEIKQENKTCKQQDEVAVSFEKLKAEGFDARAAQAIASRWPAERIERQMRWLDGRIIKSNRLGMLRAAIEQDGPRPLPLRGKGEGNGQSNRSRGQGGQLGIPNSVREAGESYGGALEKARERLNQHSKPFTP